MAVSARIIAPVVGAAITIASAFAYKYEGSRSVAYPDSGGVWTICEGHTRGVKKGDVATPGQCEQYKQDDLLRAAESVESCLTVHPTANQLAAFIDFEFNTGRFCGSSLQKRANAGDMEGACAAIGLYVYAGGQDCRVSRSCRGIIARRNDEMELCWPNFGNVESGAAWAF